MTRTIALAIVIVTLGATAALAQPAPPALAGTVNDFAKVIDESSERELDRHIQALHRATGDTVVIATVQTFQPYADIREYAVKMFENHGRGIGERGKDNGLLIVVAVEDRKVGIEVGYGLEGFVTDGFAGQTIREAILPPFRQGQYGRGLVAGTTRVISRIAEGRGVQLQDVTAGGPGACGEIRTGLRSGPARPAVHPVHHLHGEPTLAAPAALGGRPLERLEQRRRSIRERTRRLRRRVRRIRRRRRRPRRIRRVWRRPQRRRWCLWRVVTMDRLRNAFNFALVVMTALTLSGCSYNRFTGQEEALKTALSEVQNQMQRRNDLIPNLVATVQGYASQERDIFTAIAESRARMMSAKTPDDQIEAANAQTSALSRLLAVVENYPQLKSDANFQRLMDELAGTENRIAVARQRYNDAARQYNTLRRSFPSNVTAKMFGFKEYKYFEAPPDAQKLPKVDFKR